MNRKETERAIAVMQAYVDGKQIEATGQEGCDSPLWDWSKYSYQVKPEPNMSESPIIQHLIFLATYAEHYLDATNNLHKAYDEEGYQADTDKVIDAEATHSESFQRLSGAIYELRKRLDQPR